MLRGIHILHMAKQLCTMVIRQLINIPLYIKKLITLQTNLHSDTINGRAHHNYLSWKGIKPI